MTFTGNATTATRGGIVRGVRGKHKEGKVSDQYKHCKVRGDLTLCQNTPCFLHENWHAVETTGEISKIKAELEALKTTVSTFLHDLDAHEKQVKPSEIRMNHAMWMQVAAFRRMVAE